MLDQIYISLIRYDFPWILQFLRYYSETTHKKMFGMNSQKKSKEISVICGFIKALIFIIGQISFFEFSILGKNQFLNWEKVLKLPKMQFHKKKFVLFDFTSFFVWNLLNFLTRYDLCTWYSIL